MARCTSTFLLPLAADEARGRKARVGTGRGLRSSHDPGDREQRQGFGRGRLARDTHPVKSSLRGLNADERPWVERNLSALPGAIGIKRTDRSTYLATVGLCEFILWRLHSEGWRAFVQGAVPRSLSAFDAAGNTNCSGTPKTCTPLWTSAGSSVSTPPAIANGVVYESTEGYLLAFDAAGNKNCSGIPKACSPLWYGNYAGATPFGDAPAVANGVVFVGTENDNLYAFDAAGNVGCSAPPNQSCNPLWTATTGASLADSSSPAIANGMVYEGSTDDNLYAYGLP